MGRVALLAPIHCDSCARFSGALEWQRVSNNERWTGFLGAQNEIHRSGNRAHYARDGAVAALRGHDSFSFIRLLAPAPFEPARYCPTHARPVSYDRLAHDTTRTPPDEARRGLNARPPPLSRPGTTDQPHHVTRAWISPPRSGLFSFMARRAVIVEVIASDECTKKCRGRGRGQELATTNYTARGDVAAKPLSRLTSSPSMAGPSI